MKWEYTVEYVRANVSMTDALKIANGLGAQGWEIIRISGDTVRGLEFIFKRPLPDPAPIVIEKGKASGRR